MLIKTFWKLLIKIIGLWFLFSCISIIPQFLSAFHFTNGTLDTEVLILIWLSLFGIIIINVLFIRLFLFKTDWIIEKLKLENNFTEERIDVNIKSSTILTISIIVIGGLILVESIPSFFSLLFGFFQQRGLFKEYHEASWLIFHFIKIIIGYLLMTKVKSITNYIEKKS